MEYIIITLLLLCLIILIFLLVKLNSNKKNIPEFDTKQIEYELKLYLKQEYGELKLDLSKIVNESNDKNKNNLLTFSESIVKKVDEQFISINKKVEERLDGGFKKSQETFVNVVERLAKIDEAQKNIEKLSTEVFSLNNLLSDKQTRGTFGEVQLHQVVQAVFGYNNKLYEEQKLLSNGKRADLIIHAPKPLGSIVIDSKFPLNAYQKMYDTSLSSIERNDAKKQFKDDVKKHLNDIASKYIILDETANQAVMFIPAEAIFSEIINNHIDLVEYSNRLRVWFTSPTTLMSTLTIIQTIVKNMERDSQANLIVEELKYLAVEFERYAERWTKLEKSANTLSDNIKDVNITTRKISNKFGHIKEGKLDSLEEIE